MIITITGYPGSGKSTLGKGIAKALGLKHYSAGDLLREIAKEKDIDLMQIQHEMEKDRNIDDELDKRTTELGEKEDDFVIDGRVAWHFIPNSIKIFVKIDLEKAAERVFRDSQQKKDERKGETGNSSVKETVQNMRQRMEMNKKRYQKLYGINYLDEKNYDVVVNTTKASIHETKKRVLKQIKEF